MLDSLKAIATQAAGLPAAEIVLTSRAPLAHQANRLHDFWAEGRHLILKEYLLPDEKHEAAAREYRALGLMTALDLAPRPVFYDAALGPAVVYEFMEGEMWDRSKPTAARWRPGRTGPGLAANERGRAQAALDLKWL